MTLLIQTSKKTAPCLVMQFLSNGYAISFINIVAIAVSVSIN